MASPAVVENLPPSLNSSAEQPPLFDGTTKLYTCYTCPFAQRVWIARNYKGLQDKIKLVPLILEDRPAWYKEKVYSVNKVPALEHNGKIIGESLDLIKYVDSNFEGPSLFPDDPEKKKFVEELWSYVDEFIKIVYTSFKGEGPKNVVLLSIIWRVLLANLRMDHSFSANSVGWTLPTSHLLKDSKSSYLKHLSMTSLLADLS
ncbi:protein IN2-1 homolog B-like isoform X1 [Eucalyptus grandis]|uniref:protein IN2-1 homolog B-like isoform X1 n=1 Tax=Eucalyptus grandis TaxID=71139 RepID=UPI00192E98B6|nr:protein IN2-1 homolog B-like isoform X1 [Eucalyptus grandis]XP_039163456.1 protein IN2-1 homolog B-like isoform X1 [Eucalyptus grandis]